MEKLKVVSEFIEVVNERDEKTGQWFIQGNAIQMNQINGNGRIYPDAPMMEQMDKYIVEYFNNGRAVGELNHPKKAEDQVSIDPERISHKFIKLERQGNSIFQKSVIVEGNKCGDVVINLMKAGVTMGLSSRALAMLVKKEKYTETNCRKIITPGDIVYDPSAPDCFIEGVLEGKEWVYQNGVIVEAKNIEEIVESSQKQFKNMTNKTKSLVVEKVMFEYFENLLSKLKK